MMMRPAFSSLAIASALALAISGCGRSNTSLLPAPGAPPPNLTGATTGTLTARIVGVGDSLTAGVQSGALLGSTIAPNPLGAGSPFPVVPNTQGHGYYARLWSQANGGADPLAVGTSPLPLIAPPGLGSILIPTTAGGLTSIQAPCTGNNALAYTFSTALQTRLNPTATPLDVAVPGQTLHEALAQFQPTGVCNGAGLPTMFQGLNSLVGSENLNFYPILASFGPNVTQVQAAVSLRPTLAVVWLGDNDLLKFLFGNGGFPATDPGAFQADITSVIQQLQATGAKVAVANLFDVLNAAFFVPVARLPQTFVAQLGPLGVAPATAQALAAQTQAFLQSTYGLGQQAYLTLTGVNKIQAAVTAFLTGGAPSLTAALSAPAVRLVAGDFVGDQIAQSGQSLNNAYNAAIGTAANATGAALVDLRGTFAPVFASGSFPLPSNPKCCTPFYGGGLFSLDGLNPSDTGYAILTNAFIGAIDAKFGGTIPLLSTAQIAAINATDLYSPH